MTGSRGTRLAPDPPGGPRTALVVATSRYDDPELSQLRAPSHDAEDLAEVLGDPGIGAFMVTQVINADERQVRRAIGVFLSGRGVGDLVVVYLSCHGVLDRRNRLYFAASDTLKTQLGATGIPAAWLMDELEECRARSKVLILDCCFSGAFAHGSKGDADLDLERRLAGHGRGQAVLTASRAGEYSFEGQALRGAASAGSVFTVGLVEGLRTGAADVGGDGYVSVDEAFDYASGYVLSSGASQTPQRWLYGGEGAIVLARSPAGVAVTAAPLPEALAASLDSPYPAVRVGAVNALGELLSGADPSLALAAEQKLGQIADTDVPAVAAAARACLDNLESVGKAHPGEESPAAKPPMPPSGASPSAAPGTGTVQQSPPAEDAEALIAVAAPAGTAADQVHRELTDRADQERRARQEALDKAARQPERRASPEAGIEPSMARSEDGQSRTDEERAPKAPGQVMGVSAASVNQEGPPGSVRQAAVRAAKPRAFRHGIPGLSVLGSKRTTPRPRIQYFLLFFVALALGIGGTIGVQYYPHQGPANGWFQACEWVGYIGAIIMFGRAAFSGRVRRKFWLNKPPWLDAELSSDRGIRQQDGDA